MSLFCNHKWKRIDKIKVNLRKENSKEIMETYYKYVQECTKCGKLKQVVIKK